ncbi:TIGR03118 family protein [Streptosporangium vulgare]|uniref:TIGR03118 family protein n=1 Tax=Streptosporangium vulgare TaxID=46190 RepID=UPI003CD0711B
MTGWNAEADPDDAIISAFVRGADFKGLAWPRRIGGRCCWPPTSPTTRSTSSTATSTGSRSAAARSRTPACRRTTRRFNVEVVGNSILVAYAKRDPETGKSVAGQGKGFVSQFNGSGRFVGRFAARGALNAPWAMTLAPKGFGAHSGALLVGNFGDGRINAYKPAQRPPARPAALLRRQGDHPGWPVGPGARHRDRRRHERPVVQRGQRRRHARPARPDQALGSGHLDELPHGRARPPRPPPRTRAPTTPARTTPTPTPTAPATTATELVRSAPVLTPERMRTLSPVAGQEAPVRPHRGLALGEALTPGTAGRAGTEPVRARKPVETR